MTFCLLQLVALGAHAHIDLSRTRNSVERRFEGDYVLEPRPSRYRGGGGLVIDGNSLYGSIIAELGIFIDTCTSLPTFGGLRAKMEMHVSKYMADVRVGGVASK